MVYCTFTYQVEDANGIKEVIYNLKQVILKMRRINLLCLLCCLPLLVMAKGKRVLSAAEYGIVGDGTTLNTSNIQKVVDELGRQGGGTLRFTEGTYLTGCIVLRSGVEISIDRDAVLLGSSNPAHYQSLIPSEAWDNSTLALLVADKVQNVSITGSGLIDANGRALALNIDSLRNLPTPELPTGPAKRERSPETMRPKLLFASHCQNLRVDGLQLLNSACWGLSFHSCRNLTVHAIDFTNRAYWNNDGIDITDCKQVHISKCRINSADDGICLKSYDTTSCNEDVLIEDCHIRSSASAVKFGTASWGGFRNVTVRNITVQDTYRSAIALECVDGGTLQDVLVENIHATNTGNPVFIRLGHRNGDAAGKLRNVTIRRLFVEMPFGIPDSDYDVRGPEFGSHYNPRPSSITGIPGHPVENVRLEDIEIVYPGRASKGIFYYPLSQIAQVPEKIKSYPEFSMFGELPAWGFYVRHAQGITFHNVRLSLKDEDFRPAFIFDDAQDAVLERVSLPILGSGRPFFARESKFTKNCLEADSQIRE